MVNFPYKPVVPGQWHRSCEIAFRILFYHNFPTSGDLSGRMHLLMIIRALHKIRLIAAAVSDPGVCHKYLLTPFIRMVTISPVQGAGCVVLNVRPGGGATHKNTCLPKNQNSCDKVIWILKYQIINRFFPL
jgi:hypothetical protein